MTMDDPIPSDDAIRGRNPRQPAEDGGGSLYFAYGSNLHVAQMASRCPASVFQGRAVLRGYRWQINERGVANVVESTRDSDSDPDDSYVVEGLLYRISPEDEASLDRSEGVSQRFYEKRVLRVVSFQPHEAYAGLKSSEVARLLSEAAVAAVSSRSASSPSPSLGSGDAHDDGRGGGGRGPAGSGEGGEEVRALVYVSGAYTADGPIREEYVGRLRRAAADAVALGVSRGFVDEHMAPHLLHAGKGTCV
ncbi:hypothetical protein SAMD00023353_2300510 [Rosellinia necatrix]|uniref:gamma-glutamylcyclotransferase n=1 Tax=Rosellinia necatrix TaxID=77044 RepID=A0A1W2TGI1_ROSNE|nr:hypothetical protein SAMD00023353_2300510 [Rosellinia necatrix]